MLLHCTVQGAAEGSGGSGVGSEECVWRTLQAETNHMLSKLSTMEGPSKELSEVSVDILSE